MRSNKPARRGILRILRGKPERKSNRTTWIDRTRQETAQIMIALGKPINTNKMSKMERTIWKAVKPYTKQARKEDFLEGLSTLQDLSWSLAYVQALIGRRMRIEFKPLCPKCWTINPEDAQYCVNCGAALPKPTPKTYDEIIKTWPQRIENGIISPDYTDITLAEIAFIYHNAYQNAADKDKDKPEETRERIHKTVPREWKN